MPIIRPDFRGGRGGSGVMRPDYPGAGGATWSGPAPLAYYRWDTDTGATATDSSGNFYDAAMTPGQFAYVTADGSDPAVPAIGSYDGLVLDQSAAFNGGIVLPTLPASPGTSGTISAWLKPNTITNSEYIYSGAKNGQPTNRSNLYMYWNSSKLRVGGDTTDVDSTSNAVTSAWQLWTWTRAATEYVIYLNGAVDGSGISNSLERDDNGQRLFGRNGDAATAFRYDGYVKDFTLWDVELTPDDVTALYNGGTPLDLV